MKRSTQIGLVLLGVGGIALAMNANKTVDTGESNPVVYKNLDECIASALRTEAQCRTDFAEVTKRHEESAPRFADQTACEAQYGAGQCGQRQASSGSSMSSYFIPALAGYMIARHLSAGQQAQPLYQRAGERTYRPAPNMAGIPGVISNARPAPSAFSSATARGPSAVAPASRPSTSSSSDTSRGGFGSTASSMPHASSGGG
jgi:uncharacterized protein YgiB involved in biofilm formation